MHSSEREKFILSILTEQGFVSFRALEKQLSGSSATIRRDLERLDKEGKLIRVRGGAKQITPPETASNSTEAFDLRLDGTPFHHNITIHQDEKRAIGKAAAALCQQGDGVMIDGGSTTFHMCPYLESLKLQVLTNSLHLVAALQGQMGTRVMIPGGAVFPEQNIVLPIFGEDCMPKFHAPKLFMGAGSIGPQGLMQEDVVLVAGERRFIERAEQVIVLADASKFQNPSGNVVCPLQDIDILITDDRLTEDKRAFIRDADIQLIIV